MKLILLANLLLLLILTFTQLWAGEAVKLVSGNDYQPFTDETLPRGGLSSAIVRRVFEEAGMEVKLEFMPWARGYESARNSVHDATFPYVRRAEREKDFLYSAPINTITQLVYVRQDREIEFSRAEDLIGLSTCVPRGYALTHSIAQLIENEKIRQLSAPDINQCFLMLNFGRVDFLTFNQYVGWSAAMEMLGDQATEKLRTLDTPLETESLHLIVSRSRADAMQLINSFNASLSSLRSKGVIKQIEQDYLQALNN